VIAAGLIALAAVGPGRYSIDRIVRERQQEYRRKLAPASVPIPAQTTAARPHYYPWGPR
jgi:putative oxidoreductase